MMSLIFLVFLGFVPLTLSLPTFPGQADLVTSLPDVTFPIPYKQYSGYLELEDSIKFHYWLFESQSGHPESDPVVQWLNGGPTASGLFGAFTELGPIRVEVNGSFSSNPFSWNLKANLLVIESPVGVGFSYKIGADNYPNTDDKTADLNLQAIRQFFIKFPHLAANAFYITGESYAGRYIPQYSVQAIKAKFPTNFKGIAIGNGYFHGEQDLSNLFYYYHGIQDDTDFQFPHNIINIYNILANCVDGLTTSSHNTYFPYPSEWSKMPRTLNSDLPKCDGTPHLVEWLNRRDVRNAVHIDENYTQEWVGVGGADYTWGFDSMAANISFIVDSGLKVIIYNGDLDARCNFIGGREFTKNLGYKKLSFDTWTVDNYFGGYRTQYEKNLTFTTVRGAGHMVPMDQPAAALKMLNEFLLGF